MVQAGMAENEGSSRPRDGDGRRGPEEQAEPEAQSRGERDAEDGETEETAPDEQPTSRGGERDGEGAETQQTDADQQPAAGQREGGGGSRVEDISGTTAPSIGPGSVVEREPVEERLARHEQSNVDAMGQDKRRQVVGKTYGPTLARQLALYAIFLVIVAAIAFGVKVAVDHFDQPPKHFAAKAPWAQPGVKQTPPKPLQ
jgi:hypothetical protein